jgi:hypothetical protein
LVGGVALRFGRGADAVLRVGFRLGRARRPLGVAERRLGGGRRVSGRAVRLQQSAPHRRGGACRAHNGEVGLRVGFAFHPEFHHPAAVLGAHAASLVRVLPHHHLRGGGLAARLLGRGARCQRGSGRGGTLRGALFLQPRQHRKRTAFRLKRWPYQGVNVIGVRVGSRV